MVLGGWASAKSQGPPRACTSHVESHERPIVVLQLGACRAASKAAVTSPPGTAPAMNEIRLVRVTPGRLASARNSYVPAGTAATDSVRVVVTVPPAAGVTIAGSKVQLAREVS